MQIKLFTNKMRLIDTINFVEFDDFGKIIFVKGKFIKQQLDKPRR